MPLTPQEVQQMKDAFKQADAICALEGFQPDEETHTIQAALLGGRVTHAQVIEEMCDYAMQHKTTKGFIESRTWA